MIRFAPVIDLLYKERLVLNRSYVGVRGKISILEDYLTVVKVYQKERKKALYLMKQAK